MKVTILGSAYSIPDEEHENTHLIVIGETRTVLIDCVSNPVVRLKRAGVDYQQLTDLVVTHFHPDHVSGVPLLLMDMWLMGRRSALNVYGLHHTVDRIEGMMRLYDWEVWPDFFPVVFHRLPANEQTLVIEWPEFSCTATPVKHLIPTIGLRFDFHRTKKSFAYSSDTEPCLQMVKLAENVDVLIHEATGESAGHSSARQAGEVASQAGAKALYLIHYSPDANHHQEMLWQAQQTYLGPVALAKDFAEFKF